MIKAAHQVAAAAELVGVPVEALAVVPAEALVAVALVAVVIKAMAPGDRGFLRLMKRNGRFEEPKHWPANKPAIEPMTNSEDVTTIVRAIDDVQRLLRAHVELSADAAMTMERLGEVLGGQTFVEALDRVRLRSLRQGLGGELDLSTHT